MFFALSSWEARIRFGGCFQLLLSLWLHFPSNRVWSRSAPLCRHISWSLASMANLGAYGFFLFSHNKLHIKRHYLILGKEVSSPLECVLHDHCIWNLAVHCVYLPSITALSLFFPSVCCCCWRWCSSGLLDRVTLDTPMNRKFMPDADFGSWTSLEYVTEWVQSRDKSFFCSLF